MLRRSCILKRGLVPLCVRHMGASGTHPEDGIMPVHTGTTQHKYRDQFLETEVAAEAARVKYEASEVESHLAKNKKDRSAGVLGFGLAATAVSKEIIVLDADVVAGTFLAGATYTLVKKAGPSVVEALDNRAKGIHTTMSEGKNMQIEAFEAAIAEEKEAAASLAVAGEIFDMKRELAAIELEAEYRRRIKMVHAEVKRRLDYQVELENTKKAFIRDHIVNWLEAKVIESITPEQEEANINQCIAKLATLA